MLISPFTDFFTSKVRPAVVVAETPDIHGDVIVCMISSATIEYENRFHISLLPTAQNGLRSVSTIRTYRIATVDATKILTTIGKLTPVELKEFSIAFQSLVSS